MIRWLRDMFRESPEVRDALQGSKERLAESERFLARIEREAAPLHQALRENGFAPAVAAMFQRRAS